MNLFESTVGPLLLGIFINTYLYGIVSFQYASYYNSVFNDTLWIRLTVFSLFCIDTFHSFSLVYLAWAYTIKEGITTPYYLLEPFWPYASSAFVTTVTACLTQAYLAHRILRLKKSVGLYIVVLVLAASAFVGGITFAVKACLLRSSSDPLPKENLDTALIVWCSLEIAVDIFITGLLLHSLSQSRTGFQKSDRVINRLMQTTIQSGLLCSIASILVLVLFVAFKKAQISSIIGVPLGRLYTYTLMDTLLCRKTLREILSMPGDSKDMLNGSKNFELYVRKDIQTDIHIDNLDVLETSPRPAERPSRESSDKTERSSRESSDKESDQFAVGE